jgi:uncharacterized protein (DUF433 family)
MGSRILWIIQILAQAGSGMTVGLWCVYFSWRGGNWFADIAAVAKWSKAIMKNFERIPVYPGQMGGVPCVRHLRIPVATVLRLLAGGLSDREILSEYPDLQTESNRECLRFEAASAMERVASGAE